MRVVRRLSDLWSAHLHELIERFESPEVMLKQAVREMDESLQSSLTAAARVIAHEKLLTRQLAELTAQVARHRQQAEAAVRGQDDSAARHALAEKQTCERSVTTLTAQLAEVAQAATHLRRQTATMRRRVAEARRQQALLSARQQAADSRSRSAREVDAAEHSSLSDTAWQKFEHFRRKVEQSEAEADALAELVVPEQSECFQSSRSDAKPFDPIDAELSALKQSLQPAVAEFAS